MKHIPIYIINLSKDIERKKFIVQQMRKNNIVDYSFFVAIYAKDFTTKQIDSQYDRERVRKELGRELKTGEIGCTLSHFALYHKMIDENIPYMIIMEDDVSLDPKVFTWFKHLTIDKLKGYDYVFGNYTILDRKGILGYRSYLQEQKRSIGKKVYHILLLCGGILGDLSFEIWGKLGLGIARQFKPLYLTGCYIISQECARKILSINKKVFLPADHYVEKYKKVLNLKVGFIYPLLITQSSSFETNIQK